MRENLTKGPIPQYQRTVSNLWSLGLRKGDPRPFNSSHLPRGKKKSQVRGFLTRGLKPQYQRTVSNLWSLSLKEGTPRPLQMIQRCLPEVGGGNGTNRNKQTPRI